MQPSRCTLLGGLLKPRTQPKSRQLSAVIMSPVKLVSDIAKVNVSCHKIPFTNFISAFDVVSGLPSWTSYTIYQPRLATVQPQWRLDVRLEATHASICDRFPDGIDSTWSAVPLFPFGLFPLFIFVHS